MNQQQKANLKFINIYSKFWYIQCANQKLLILTWVSIILPFRGHSFMIFAKWKLLNASPFISTAIQFWSVLPYAVLQWMSIIEFRRTPLPKKWYFKIFLISFNSEINKLRHSFCLCYGAQFYKFHKYNKTDWKANTC